MSGSEDSHSRGIFGRGSVGGLFLAIAACVSSSLMGLSFFYAHKLEPNFSSLAGSFVRVGTTVCVLLLLAGSSRGRSAWPPLRGHRCLWMWGLFGGLTVASYFTALHSLGAGLTAVLGATSGIFTVVLAPVVTDEKISWEMIVAVLGAFAGVCLIIDPQQSGAPGWGCTLALGSGFFGVLAYLMLAKSASPYPTRIVLSVWCIGAVLVHLVLLLSGKLVFPRQDATWFYLVSAGLFATFSQVLLAKAYWRVPATKVAAISYLTPVFSLGLEALFWQRTPSPAGLVGSGLVVAFGATLPFLRTPSSKRVGRE